LQDGAPANAVLLPDFVPVVAKHHIFHIEVSQYFGFAEGRLTTLGYIYQLHTDVSKVDGGMDEIMGFHWHPAVGVKNPHLHVNSDHAALNPLTFRKMHIPTERLALEDFIEFLITQLHVKPEREDWESILAENRKAFIDKRSWPKAGATFSV
jgi:hypothetical protein